MTILSFLNRFKSFLLDYATPLNLSHLWNFGVLSLFFLILQIITGLFLAMHYVAEESMAFLSVEDIMRNVSYG
jgi:ubiquinol-cytochrome c reductase cytochrome b subunit